MKQRDDRMYCLWKKKTCGNLPASPGAGAQPGTSLL